MINNFDRLLGSVDAALLVAPEQVAGSGEKGELSHQHITCFRSCPIKKIDCIN